MYRDYPGILRLLDGDSTIAEHVVMQSVAIAVSIQQGSLQWVTSYPFVYVTNVTVKWKNIPKISSKDSVLLGFSCMVWFKSFFYFFFFQLSHALPIN